MKVIPVTSEITENTDTISFNLSETQPQPMSKPASPVIKIELQKEIAPRFSYTSPKYKRGSSIFTRNINKRNISTQTGLPVLLLVESVSFFRPLSKIKKAPLQILDKVCFDESQKISQIRRLSMNEKILINKRTFIEILSEKENVITGLVSQIFDPAQDSKGLEPGLAEKNLAISVENSGLLGNKLEVQNFK